MEQPNRKAFNYTNELLNAFSKTAHSAGCICEGLLKQIEIPLVLHKTYAYWQGHTEAYALVQFRSDITVTIEKIDEQLIAIEKQMANNEPFSQIKPNVERLEQFINESEIRILGDND